MGDFLIGIGFLLALIGPLLLLPVAWLLYRFVARPLIVRAAAERLSEDSAKGLALGITLGLLAAAMAASYFPGKRQFDALCDQHAQPQLRRGVFVDGFFADKLFPYQAVRYLTDGGFAYVEAPDPYRDGVYLRYTLGQNNQAESAVITAPVSAFGFRETFSQPSGSLTMIEKSVYEIASGDELGRAASISYRGGPLSLFLGSYATSSCPSILTPQGSEDYNAFYHLETLTLRSLSP